MRRKPVRAVLAIERARRDAGWLDLCSQLDVILTWPENFAATLSP